MLYRKGFTLVELLIVIAIIAILAAVAFVALDPLTRFRDSRDAARWQDITAIIDAIKLDQVDNGGEYSDPIPGLTDGYWYMIGTATAGCDDNNAGCDNGASGDTACADLSFLVNEGYLPELPISPNGQYTWSDSITGYLIQTSSTDSVTIQACESENTDEIYVTR